MAAPIDNIPSKVLQAVGSDPILAGEFIRLCKALEKTNHAINFAIRDKITGPLVDALFDPNRILQKKLSNGIEFQYLYRSRMARELVMSEPEIPDHIWEPQTTKLLCYLSKNASHVVVGGAYFGDHVLPLAWELKDNGGICHAFEPNPDQFHMLQENLKLNRLENVQAHRLGLWSCSGLKMSLIGEDASAFPKIPTEQESSGDLVATLSLDDYCDREGIGRIDLLMLDIEGGEFEVFKGAQKRLETTVGQAPHLVFEIHAKYSDWSRGLHHAPVVEFLRFLGYHVYAVRDYTGNRDFGSKPIELVPPEETYLEGPPHGFNMVAVKNMGLLQGQLFRLVHGVSPKLLLHKDPSLHHPLDGF